MGIYGFSEGDLVEIFGVYAMSGRRMNYDEFVNNLFGVTPSKLQSSRTFRTVTDISRKMDWERVKGYVESIRYRLCKMKMYSFMDFRMELEEQSPVGIEQLMKIGRKCGVSFSETDYKELFHFFRAENKFLDVEQFSDLLCINFNKDRGEAVDKMFGQLDRRKFSLISMELLEKLFIPRQHYLFKTGRRTQEEVKEEWLDSLDKYKRLTKSMEVDIGQFRLFWKLMSAYIKNDHDFTNLLIQCFRYSDLSNIGNTTKGEALSEISDNYKMDLEHQVRVQIAQKGNVGCFILLKNMVSRDHNMDGMLDQREFNNAMSQSRIDLSHRNLEELFKIHANKGLMDIWKFLDAIVIKFKNDREEALSDLFKKLGPDRNTRKLKLSNFESYFFPRGHPDFKRLYRADYEIKQEFTSHLRQFLNNFQGSALDLNLNSFMRFFEFYCFALDDSGFFSFMEKGFKFPDHNRNFMDKKTYNDPYQNKQTPPSQLSRTQRSAMNRPARSIRSNARSMRSNNQSMRSNNRSRRSNARTSRYNEHRKTHYSPHSVSVISRRTEYPEQIESFNSKLQNANFQKKQIVGQKQSRFWEMLAWNIRDLKNFTLLLEIEYEMTKRADEQGNADFDVFQSVLEETGVTKGLNEEQIRAVFMEGLQFGKLHVQGFLNDLRGQITEEREFWTIELFDKIRDPVPDTIKLDTFRKLFKEKFYKWNSVSPEDNQENFQYMLDLFNYLNLAIKKTDEIDLDDFLYLFDNFSFFIQDDQDFRYFLEMCF
jgi:hypothetical protein